MAEFDLVPADYRTRIRQRGMLRRYGAAIITLNVVIMACTGVLGLLSKQALVRVDELEMRSAVTELQRVQLQQLQVQLTEYQRRLSLLRGLRAGAAVEDVFNIIDAALTENDIWFSNWKFRRAGVVVNGEAREVETGYFLIVQADEQSGEVSDWQVETNMTLQGQARDHQALSTFLRALFDQPDIKDINIRRTSSADYANGRVVNFELDVVLASVFEVS